MLTSASSTVRLTSLNLQEDHAVPKNSPQGFHLCIHELKGTGDIELNQNAIIYQKHLFLFHDIKRKQHI